MNQTPSKKTYGLEERIAIFGENIIHLCKNVRHDAITKPIVNQFVRSRTSVGANYMEANGASSKKDFTHKIYICKKEAQETNIGLECLHKLPMKGSWKYELCGKRLKN